MKKGTFRTTLDSTLTDIHKKREAALVEIDEKRRTLSCKGKRLSGYIQKGQEAVAEKTMEFKRVEVTKLE